MTIDLDSTASSDFMTILTQAAIASQETKFRRPSSKALIAALLQAEKATKQQRIQYPIASLLGGFVSLQLVRRIKKLTK
jgi:hypothetical protein